MAGFARHVHYGSSETHPPEIIMARGTRAGFPAAMAPGGVEPPHTDSKSVALSAELRGPAQRVADGTRTHDHLDHNQGLYQLSYRHRGRLRIAASNSGRPSDLGPAHPDVAVQTPDREHDVVLPKGAVPARCVLVVGIDERSVDAEDCR